MPESSAITLDSLTKLFTPARGGWRAFLQPFEKPSTAALVDVSLNVQQGEPVALLGTNGAGKSTLLKIVATLLLPSAGRASVDGFDCERQSADARKRIGYHAGADHGFYPRLSARENLKFFGGLNRIEGTQLHRRIDELATQFRLGDDLDRQVRTLSSGTVQRLSLSRALLHRPRVLLLDEPTRSLDAIAAVEFRNYLKSQVLQSGDTAILFASHALTEIEALANRVAVIDAGKIVACDTIANLLRHTGASSLEDIFLRLVGRAPHNTERLLL